MNIILAGDSWAYPNYTSEHGDPPETHLFYLLNKVGHYVVNCSQNGVSNFIALQHIVDFFNGHQVPYSPHYKTPIYNGETFDFIIWFNTSPLRDTDSLRFSEVEYYKELNHRLTQVSQYAKIIAIGGCAMLNPLIDKSLFHYYIQDWKSEIVKEQLPEAIWFGAMKLNPEDFHKWLLARRLESTKVLVEEAKVVIHALSQSADFPDNGHPGKKPHAELLKRLTKDVFEKNDK